jgi:hypothetical protein
MRKTPTRKSKTDRRKNISLDPIIRRMGEKIAEERGMTFSGFLADLIRRENIGDGPTSDFSAAGVAARFSEFYHEQERLMSRIKTAETMSDTLYGELRRLGRLLGQFDQRVAAIEKAGKEPDSLGQSGGIEQKPVPAVAALLHVEGKP